MKPVNRTLFILATVIALIAAGASYWAGEQISRADKMAGDARTATFTSYRIAQSLKAMAAGHELTMNEFYSTVLTFPSYQKKATAQKSAIELELAALVGLREGDQATATDLARLFKEMDAFRIDLEDAMTGDETDWDAAREALFKLNVVSVQAIQQADFLAQSASQRASILDSGWQAQQSGAMAWLRITTALALLAGILIIFGSLRTRA